MQDRNEAERNLSAMRNLALTPDPEPDPICYCDYCGAPMYEGERAWTIGFDRICDDCAHTQYSEVLQDD